MDQIKKRVNLILLTKEDKKLYTQNKSQEAIKKTPKKKTH